MPRVKKPAQLSDAGVSSSIHSQTSATSTSSGNGLVHMHSMWYKKMSAEAALAAISNHTQERVSTPATVLSNALERVAVSDTLMKHGLNVKKLSVSSNNGTLRSRVVTVTPDRHAIFLMHNAEEVQKQQKYQQQQDDDMHKNVAQSVANKLKVPVWTPSKGFSGQYLRYVDIADLTFVQVGAVSTQAWEDFYERKANSRQSKLNCRSMDADELDKEKKDLISQMVTIWHHGNQQQIHLLIQDRNEREQLCETVKQMMAVYQSTRVWIDNESLLLRYIWYDIDTDKNGGISSNEFHRICQRCNLFLPNAKQMYNVFCKEILKTNKDLTYTQCVSLLRWCKMQLALDATAGMKGDHGVRGFFGGEKNKGTTEDRRPATLVWNLAFGEDVTSVTAEVLWKKFLVGAQGELGTTLDDAASLINSLNSTLAIDAPDDDDVDAENTGTTNATPNNEQRLTKERFSGYLYSTWNDAYDPEVQLWPQHKLDKPISHYWINSSHNTYLTDDQLKSRSSVEAYMHALLRGTKCLEFDCWDGDEKVADIEARSYVGKPLVPIVYHGHTLTSKISFDSICRVVQNYVEANPNGYPIILSIENHCSHAYQLEMAKIMHDVFREQLYVPPVGLFESDSKDNLPSPESLRGRVVVKGKRPPEPEDDEGSITDEMDLQKTNSTDTGKSDASRTSKNSVLPKVVSELASVTLFHGAKFKSFDQSVLQLNSYMHSIGETKIAKILHKHPDQGRKWRSYNASHMTRTYPAGTRVDSSNYNPILAWYVGCQLVALNFQTSDTPLILNDGRFRQHGGCGYILKPPDISGTGQNDNAVVPASDVPAPKKITIQILSGSCLPKPQGAATGEYIDPFVRVELHDVVGPPHNDREEFKHTVFATSAVSDNGFCPLWGKTTDGKTFRVHTPSVAMFLFTLMDDDVAGNDRVADAAIPASCLRPGFRSIQLHAPDGTRSGPFACATLLVKIVISDEVSEKGKEKR